MHSESKRVKLKETEEGFMIYQDGELVMGFVDQRAAKNFVTNLRMALYHEFEAKYHRGRLGVFDPKRYGNLV